MVVTFWVVSDLIAQPLDHSNLDATDKMRDLRFDSSSSSVSENEKEEKTLKSTLELVIAVQDGLDPCGSSSPTPCSRGQVKSCVKKRANMS